MKTPIYRKAPPVNAVTPLVPQPYRSSLNEINKRNAQKYPQKKKVRTGREG